MNLNDALRKVVEPGLKLLPAKMNTIEAKVMLLAIGMQESRFEHRKQIGGPARGYWQFERGGGFNGVISHRSSKGEARRILNELQIKESDGFEAIAYNDSLALCFARLLLWTDPQPMPKLYCDPDESWDYYLRVWRPGKPHRSFWNAFWLHAVEAVKQNDVYTGN